MTKPKHPLQAMQVENKHPLEQDTWNELGIKTYKGVLVYKRNMGGYIVLNKIVKTPEEVDKAIDEAAKSIDKSIKHGNDIS